MLIVYVDDCILSGNEHHINRIVQALRKRFKLKDAPLDDFLGMRIQRLKDSITIDMQVYETKTIKELGLGEANPSNTPLSATTKLTPAPSYNDVFEKQKFMKFLGKLIWITKLHPELDFATNILCRVAKAPTKDAFTTLKRVFRFLKGNPSKITFKKTSTNAINAYCDASFAEDHERKSHGGALLLIGPNIISHYSRIQRHVTTSTTEAELTELFRATKETIFLRGLLTDFGFKNVPTTIFTDSQSALTLLSSDVLKRSTKHMATKLEFCRQLRRDGTHNFQKIKSEDNLADILTKALPGPQFTHLSNQILSSRRAVRICHCCWPIRSDPSPLANQNDHLANNQPDSRISHLPGNPAPSRNRFPGEGGGSAHVLHKPIQRDRSSCEYQKHG